MPKVKQCDKIELAGEQIKAIRGDIHPQTRELMKALESDYDTYVMMKVNEDNTIEFLFRPDDDNPEVVANVITLKLDSDKEQWYANLIGGVFYQKSLHHLAELLNLFNFHRLNNIEMWYN